MYKIKHYKNRYKQDSKTLIRFSHAGVTIEETSYGSIQCCQMSRIVSITYKQMKNNIPLYGK